MVIHSQDPQDVGTGQRQQSQWQTKQKQKVGYSIHHHKVTTKLNVKRVLITTILRKGNE